MLPELAAGEPGETGEAGDAGDAAALPVVVVAVLAQPDARPQPATNKLDNNTDLAMRNMLDAGQRH
ncbi:MAG: hypothetical protein AB7K09_08695 [Planctomycetota bacterium]